MGRQPLPARKPPRHALDANPRADGRRHPLLEDVGEAAYRVERMLLTLLDAGLLDGQKAILLGDFAQADDAWRFPGDATLAGAFSYIRSRLGRRIPLVAGLPFGHIRRKATLPVGLSGRLRISAGHAELVWRGRP